MTDVPAELPPWSRRRWCLSIALVLVFQTVLVFVLERHSTGVRHKTVAMPVIHLRDDISLEQFGVGDPTVFVLPHRNGFSGEAWLNHLPSVDFQPPDWTEPPRALPFAAEALGANFKEFIIANPASEFETIATIEPAPSVPFVFPVERPPAKSTLRIEGPLAQRRLLAPPQLPVLENVDLVPNSVVQLLVDAQGRTISAVLLASGIRLPLQGETDKKALEIAKAAQFEPTAAGTVTVGTMTFEWQTVPPPSTNSPAEIP